MTIKDYLESSKLIEELAKNVLGDYADFYNLERYDSGNIEFSIPQYRIGDVIKLVPNDVEEFIISVQFCYVKGNWSKCMTSKITNIKAYKEKLGI